MSKQGISGEVIKGGCRIGQIPVAEVGDHTKSVEYVTSMLEKVLRAGMFKDNPEQARSIAKTLSEAWMHDATIMMSDVMSDATLMSDATQMGLKVESVTKEVWTSHEDT